MNLGVFLYHNETLEILSQVARDDFVAGGREVSMYGGTAIAWRAVSISSYDEFNPHQAEGELNIQHRVLLLLRHAVYIELLLSTCCFIFYFYFTTCFYMMI